MILLIVWRGEKPLKQLVNICRKEDVKMKNDTIVNFLIVVTDKDSFIADYPNEIEDCIDGYFCEDNCIDNVPKEKGIYECEAKYWFIQGFCDGYPADGESECGFEIINSKKVY